jgi:hypothetical protein
MLCDISRITSRCLSLIRFDFGLIAFWWLGVGWRRQGDCESNLHVVVRFDDADHLGEVEAARRLEAALATIREGETTPDLGGKAGTMQMAEAVAKKLRTNSKI